MPLPFPLAAWPFPLAALPFPFAFAFRFGDGPVSAFLVARVAGRSRWQLLLHGPVGSPLPLPPGQTLWDELPRGVALAVDPDPLEL